MRYGFSMIMRGKAATPASFDALADKAEALGVDALWCSSHVAIPPLTQSRYRGGGVPGGEPDVPPTWRERYWEPWTVLAHLAARTRRVRLGTSVLILPMHDPIEVAHLAADVDQLSGGRFTLGIGVGWLAEEFALLGRSFTNRGRRCDEALAVMRTLWTEDAPSFQGRYTQFERLSMGPRPVQQPHPPLWIGGNSEAALRRTARFGECWHPNKPGLDALRDGVARLRELYAEAGRDPASIQVALKCPLVVTDRPPADPPFPTVGPLQDVVDTLRRYRDAGVSEFVFDFVPEALAPALDTMDVFASDVRPALEAG